jgi:hypothetical protein
MSRWLQGISRHVKNMPMISRTMSYVAHVGIMSLEVCKVKRIEQHNLSTTNVK